MVKNREGLTHAILTGLFVALWLTSALLFRQATRWEPEPGTA